MSVKPFTEILEKFVNDGYKYSEKMRNWDDEKGRYAGFWSRDEYHIKEADYNIIKEAFDRISF